MLNLEVRTSLSQGEAIARVKEFFAVKQGLTFTGNEEDCLTFEGGGGYVTVQLWTEGEKTTIGLVTQEWEYQVKEFGSSLPT